MGFGNGPGKAGGGRNQPQPLLLNTESGMLELGYNGAFQLVILSVSPAFLGPVHTPPLSHPGCREPGKAYQELFAKTCLARDGRMMERWFPGPLNQQQSFPAPGGRGWAAGTCVALGMVGSTGDGGQHWAICVPRAMVCFCQPEFPSQVFLG